MKLVIQAKKYPNFGKNNREHFLLAGTKVECVVSFASANVSAVTIAGIRSTGSMFTISFDPGTIPTQTDEGGQPMIVLGVPVKHLISRIDLIYQVQVTLGGLTFTALKVVQRFVPTPIGAGGRDQVDYRLTAGGWQDAKRRQRAANFATHPLLDLSELANNKIQINTLLLDITSGWQQLHRNNSAYKAHTILSQGRNLSLRVFAHTAGTPLIWYVVVPSHLRGGMSVSPHVFYQPSDNREGQWPADEATYLLRNDSFFERDGGRLMNYLLPPIPDASLSSVQSTIARARQLRNVVNFRKAVVNGRATGEFTTDHWNIGAGLQKAFEQSTQGSPKQFLLIPQRVGRADSGASESYGGAVTQHLLAVTNMAFGLIESMIELTGSGGDVLLNRDKLVLSAYSESGFDLWPTSQLLRDSLKAIIAIEPQNMNRIQNDYRPKDADGNRVGPPPVLGKDVIPGLLKRKVLVYLIGRHHLHYKPQVPDLSQIHLLPKQPWAVFRYPPDPTVNDFIKYRVHRMVVPSDDPYLLAAETTILSELSDQGITGLAALQNIFNSKGNEDGRDQHLPDDGIIRWYSHQFALSGGDDLQLNPASIYDKPIKYRTWFTVAVHEIG